MKMNNVQLTENFKLHEFDCPCCRTVRLYPRLLDFLQALRDGWKKPLIVTSGYRCEAHNAEVGGAPRSKHRLGQAVDVFVHASQQEAFRILAAQCGFSKTILYPERHFVHLEV